MIQIAATPETSWKEQGHGVRARRPDVSWLPRLFFFSFAYPLYSESIDWACPDYQALDWGCCCCVLLFVTPWAAAHQASLSLIISRPLHQWCHLAISSSDALFSFSPQSFQHQGLFQRLKIIGHSPGRLHSPHPKNAQSTESTLRRWWQSRSHYDSCWVQGTFAFVCVCMYVCVYSIVSDPLWPNGLWSAQLLCPWNFPGKNIGGGCHFLLHLTHFVSDEPKHTRRLLVFPQSKMTG